MDDFDFETRYYGKGKWRIQKVMLGPGELGQKLCKRLVVKSGEPTRLQATESFGAIELRYYGDNYNFVVAEVQKGTFDGSKFKAEIFTCP